MAITTFKADVHHVAGLNVTATSTHHTITVDEPESLGGTDKGPNPVELLLDALAPARQSPSMRSRQVQGQDQETRHSRRRRYRLGRIPRNQLSRPGYQRLRSTIDLDADAIRTP